VQTLQDFYKKHGVKYGVSSYQYVQAMNENSFQRVRMFAVKLAKMIAEDDFNMVYFDEASFNLWMRHRKTWGMQSRPVKMVLNKVRGKGVTVFGAIGTQMPKALFIMERTTNSKNFINFLRLLRRLFKDDERTIHLILDNHRGHHTLQAKEYATKKRIALHFMPPYSPELNAIEPLWSVLKRDFKKRMLEHRVDKVEEHFFR
jgi:transposase